MALSGAALPWILRVVSELGRALEMTYGKAVREELRVPTRRLRHAIPEVYAGYRELHDAALASGVLDAKTKELIARAIAVSKECDGCIAAHAYAAVAPRCSPPARPPWSRGSPGCRPTSRHSAGFLYCGSAFQAAARSLDLR
jgi:AhpD family alkylhydroperoxidase